MLGKRHELALGIIATPADRTARANIRASWLLALRLRHLNGTCLLRH